MTVILVVPLIDNLVWVMFIILYNFIFRGADWFKERIESRIGRYSDKRVDRSKTLRTCSRRETRYVMHIHKTVWNSRVGEGTRTQKLQFPCN